MSSRLHKGTLIFPFNKLWGYLPRLMTPTITRQSDILQALELCFEAYERSGTTQLADALKEHLLTLKIKFPLLEKAAHHLYQRVADEDHLDLCQRICDLDTVGGNVLIGILLQKRSAQNPVESMDHAALFIAQGARWYVSDIIGERVIGYNLLINPDLTLSLLNKLAGHPSKWVVRCLGAGSHYAIKKGLDPIHAETVFEFLLSMARAKEHHIKTGIGWAAKTCARFHPQIIQKHAPYIADKKRTGQWFRTKVNIGLARNRYAETY